jgi:hypothetical protein
VNAQRAAAVAGTVLVLSGSLIGSGATALAAGPDEQAPEQLINQFPMNGSTTTVSSTTLPTVSTPTSVQPTASAPSPSTATTVATPPVTSSPSAPPRAPQQDSASRRPGQARPATSGSLVLWGIIGLLCCIAAVLLFRQLHRPSFPRPRYLVTPALLLVLRPLFRYSPFRDAWVLRWVGEWFGPVLRRRQS